MTNRSWDSSAWIGRKCELGLISLTTALPNYPSIRRLRLSGERVISIRAGTERSGYKSCTGIAKYGFMPDWRVPAWLLTLSHLQDGSLRATVMDVCRMDLIYPVTFAHSG